MKGPHSTKTQKKNIWTFGVWNADLKFFAGQADPDKRIAMYLICVPHDIQAKRSLK